MEIQAEDFRWFKARTTHLKNEMLTLAKYNQSELVYETFNIR